MHLPFEVLLSNLPWLHAARLLLTCKIIHATSSLVSAALRRDVQKSIANKQTAYIATILGVRLLSRPRTVRRVGGYAPLLLSRLCEAYYTRGCFRPRGGAAVDTRGCFVPGREAGMVKGARNLGFLQNTRSVILDLLKKGLRVDWRLGSGKYCGSSLLHVAAGNPIQISPHPYRKAGNGSDYLQFWTRHSCLH